MKWSIIYILAVMLLTNTSSTWHAASPLLEVCDNAQDDDGDGLIDLNDPDCACGSVEPISLIPNPSFEERNCCPRERSQLNCAKTWIQASEATTDYINSCGWLGWDYLPVPLPIPDGAGCIGFRNGRFVTTEFSDEQVPNYKEYAGACLTSPLRANTSYRFRFNVGFTHAKNSPPTEIVFYGTTDCKNLPFGTGDPQFGCPSNDPDWKILGSVSASGVMSWVVKEIDLMTQEDIYAIAIGPSCRKKSGTEDLYYFFDNLVLADQKAFEFQVSPHGNPCMDTFSLQLPHYDTLQYQWYRDGIAILDATQAKLQPVGPDGNYQAQITSEEGCKVTKDFFLERPGFFEEQEVVICREDTYRFHSQLINGTGIYTETLKSIDHCDSIIQLSVTVTTDQMDSVAVKIFPGESYRVGTYEFSEPGRHLAYLNTHIGCDSTVHVDLELYEVFIPTAFSPNGDGINDTFAVFGTQDLTQIKSIRIFNRWGQIVYENRALMPDHNSQTWDGRTPTGPAPEGVYLYSLDLLMEDGKLRTKSGSITLVR